MGEESRGMHSGDDKALLEKNKKRIVKTRAQVDALERFYNEHKYPTEPMKIQLAESIGLTEKQVSGWFCHRRLKDKKLTNDEQYVTGRQDRSSGVIQDHRSGHRQDSCGSTKQGDDGNLDTREVDSERSTPKEISNADLTYEHDSHYAGNNDRVDAVSSGSSSSLGSMSNHQNGVPLDAATSSYLVPKFYTAVKGEKTRPGPSGYLKLKGQVENAAITSVKKQLGNHYREDGPPLGVEFDPLPPGAFESSTEGPTEETYYTEEAVLPASPDVSRVHQNSDIGKRREFKPSMAFGNPNTDERSFEPRRHDIPDSHTHQKFIGQASLSNGGGYYPRNNSSLQLPGGSARDTAAIESRDDYGIRTRPREVMRTRTFSSNPNLQSYGENVREEQAGLWPHRYNDVGPKVSLGEDTGNEYSNFTMRGNDYYGSGDKGLSRQTIKDGKTMYPDRRSIDENPVKAPFKNELTAPKRIREEFHHQQYLKRPSVVDINQPHKYQVVRSRAEMPASFSEETSSSVD
ncbi:hypothetical protein OROGR_002698 [Orobanche gracilis]